MARKDELRKAAEGWLTEPAVDAEPAAELPAVSLYRRSGLPDTLIAMAEDGRAWEVPDRAGGWDARVELGKAPAARGLTRLATADERRALGRIGAELGQLDQAPAAEPTPKAPRSSSGKAPATSGKGKAAAAAVTSVDPGDGGRDSQVVAYLTAAELAALVERARMDDRSVSYVVRAAVRQYLGLT